VKQRRNLSDVPGSPATHGMTGGPVTLRPRLSIGFALFRPLGVRLCSEYRKDKWGNGMVLADFSHFVGASQPSRATDINDRIEATAAQRSPRAARIITYPKSLGRLSLEPALCRSLRGSHGRPRALRRMASALPSFADATKDPNPPASTLGSARRANPIQGCRLPSPNADAPSPQDAKFDRICRLHSLSTRWCPEYPAPRTIRQLTRFAYRKRCEILPLFGGRPR